MVGISCSVVCLGLVGCIIDFDALLFPIDFWVDLVEPREAQDEVVPSAFHGVEGFVVNDRSYLEKELAFVLDRAGVVGRSIHVVDFEGFFYFPEVDFVLFGKVNVDTVDVCAAVDKNSRVDVFSVSGVEHVGWNTKLFGLFSYNYTVNVSRGSVRLGRTPLQKSSAELPRTVGSSSESGISSILADTSGFLFSGFFPFCLVKGFLHPFDWCPGFPHLKQSPFLYFCTVSSSHALMASTSMASGSFFFCSLFLWWFW